MAVLWFVLAMVALVIGAEFIASIVITCLYSWERERDRKRFMRRKGWWH